ncbi:MAG: ABC transporter substrate-binding protein [Candidatus Methanomethylicaceae archaeon]
MEKIRLLFLVVCLLGLIIQIDGFAKSAQDEIVVAHIGNITCLDPAYPNWNSNVNALFSAVYESLIRYDQNSFEFIPLLSTEVPTEENGLIRHNVDGTVSIIFPIREGVRFHHGGTLSAEDVKYSFLRKLITEGPGGEAAPILQMLTGYTSLDAWAKALEPGVEGFANASLTTVKTMFEVLDSAIVAQNGNVIFNLRYPSGLFLQYIAHYRPAGLITDKEFVISQGGWPGTWDTWQAFYNPKEESTTLYAAMDGTGPFKLAYWDRSTQTVVLTRFEEYWRGPARINTVRLLFVPEWSTRYLMLLNGDADFAYTPQEFIVQVENIPDVVVSEPHPSGVIRCFFFQWPINGTRFTGSGKLDGKGIPPEFFSDINIRKGFLYAFNWDRYINDVLRGKAFQLKGPMSNLTLAAQFPIPTYYYDRAKAIEYLKKAFDGQVWDKGFYFVAVHNVGNQLARSALELLRDELRSINPKFNFDIQAVTWTEFIPLRTSGQIPLFYSGWGFGLPDGYETIYNYLASDGYFNPFIPGVAEIAREKIDPILQAALRVFDPIERAKLYVEAITLAYEYALHWYCVEEAVQMVYRREVKGWYFHPAFYGINMPGIDFYALWKD